MAQLARMRCHRGPLHPFAARTRARRGQSVVEYLLATSVIAIALAAGFVAFSGGVGGVFENVRVTVQQPYP